ncbi:MAG: putative Ig domain-containing protein, partial [Myxococcota bacterium]
LSTTRAITLNILENANLLIVPNLLSTATYNSEYSTQLEAQGGVAPYTWIFDSGSLPDGVRLGPNGELSGTPREVGTFRFVVEARDAAPGLQAARDRNTFVLQVADAEGFTISTQSLAPAVLDTSYDQAVAASGGTPPYTWVLESGRLPDGLIGEVDSTTGEYRIRGQPQDTDITNLLVSVTDAENRQARRAFALQVLESEPNVVTPQPASDGCVCRTPTSGASTASGLIVLALLAGGYRRRRSR